MSSYKFSMKLATCNNTKQPLQD